jgi:bifunctional oligoribonuclease and PAP phosphatase NrnA
MNISTRLSPINVDGLVRRLKGARSVVLTTHKQCDGDGLGAMLAVYHALKKTGISVRALSVDSVPKKYAFLDPERYLEVFEGPHKPIQPTDIGLVFDTNDRRLVEPLFTTLEEKCREICFVDHHPVLNSGPEPTPGSFIDIRAASTGEIAYFLIRAMGIHLDEKIARALYTSISFDTQLFKFVKNSSNSHLIAADLLPFVPNAEEIHRQLFSTHTREKIAFLSKAFAQIEYYGDGRIAVLRLHQLDLTSHNLDMDDSRDVIDMIMNITSLEAAALFREDAKDEYKMSLRSKGRIEVLGVAEAFAGGGHMFAAGAYIRGEYFDIRQKVVDLLFARIDGEPGGMQNDSKAKIGPK